MDIEQPSVSDAPVDAGRADQGSVQENPRGSDSNGNEWRDRILREKKELAARYSKTEKELHDARQRIEALTGQQLQKDGKLEEYNRHLETQLKAEREKRLDDRAKFAHRTLTERLRAEAQNLGCIDLETVLKIADIDRVSISDDLSVDDTSVKLLMEDLKKTKPYLFRTNSIPVKDGSPAANLDPARQAVNKPQTKRVEDMTNEEFNEHFRQGMLKTL